MNKMMKKGWVKEQNSKKGFEKNEDACSSEGVSLLLVSCGFHCQWHSLSMLTVGYWPAQKGQIKAQLSSNTTMTSNYSSHTAWPQPQCCFTAWLHWTLWTAGVRSLAAAVAVSAELGQQTLVLQWEGASNGWGMSLCVPARRASLVMMKLSVSQWYHCIDLCHTVNEELVIILRSKFKWWSPPPSSAAS